MKIIVCLDNHNGYMFNNRRLSSDKHITDNIEKLAKTNRVIVTPYSRKLFSERSNVIVNNEPLTVASNNDYCFVEDSDINKCLNKITEIIMFKWNRDYPYDKTLSMNFDNWKLVSHADFAGNSHEKISKDVFLRKDG